MLYFKGDHMAQYEGILEIDSSRGVIYFHMNNGTTKLRICRLPKPIPEDQEFLDITHMHGANWRATNPASKTKPSYTFNYDQDTFILYLSIAKKKYAYYNISPFKFAKFRAMLRKNFGKATAYLKKTQG